MGNEDNHPTVVAIEGDGIGLEVTPWTIEAVDAAVKGAYGGEKSLRWVEALAGKRAMEATGSPLPPETVELIKTHTLALKGRLWEVEYAASTWLSEKFLTSTPVSAPCATSRV